VTRVEAYGTPKIATSIANRDLWSKVHVGARWPVVSLVHGGNLGRIRLGYSETAVRRVFADEPLFDASGHWLMILAEKRVSE
jgi:hypothetical protein